MHGGVGILATGVALVALIGVATASGSPIVSAGLDQEVELGDTVYLDGGGTHVPDGELERIEWSIETPDGRTITPDCADCERTSFQPNETGQYDVTLTAWSEAGVERSDTLYVTVGTSSPVTDDPPVQNGGGSAGGGDSCFISNTGNYGDPMNDGICNYVGGAVEAELSDNGDYVESYTVEDGNLVDRYSGAEKTAPGKWEVPADSLHHESDDIWEDHQEERDTLDLGGSNSGNSGDSGSYYDPLEDNSARDDDDSGSESDNPAGDYTLPPNYP